MIVIGPCLEPYWLKIKNTTPHQRLNIEKLTGWMTWHHHSCLNCVITVWQMAPLTWSQTDMENFWCGRQWGAVQSSSLWSLAMWRWMRRRMFSCRKYKATLVILVNNNQSIMLDSTVLHRERVNWGKAISHYCLLQTQVNLGMSNYDNPAQMPITVYQLQVEVTVTYIVKKSCMSLVLKLISSVKEHKHINSYTAINT